MSPLLAQVPTVPIPQIFFTQQGGAAPLGTSPGKFITALLPNTIVVAAAIFFFLIIGAGFSLIVGAGQNKSPQDIAKAKAALTWGVIGFLLVVSAYFILQMISFVVGVNLLSPPRL